MRTSTERRPELHKEAEVKIEMTGILIPREHNKCDAEGCNQGADTVVWELRPGRVPHNICLLHLKEKIESGEWKVST
jgi:hypothetical protein